MNRIPLQYEYSCNAWLVYSALFFSQEKSPAYGISVGKYELFATVEVKS